MNEELELAKSFLNYTNRNIFLTGKAGTGKTTFLHSLHKTSHKRMVIVAPTGVAAINAGGVTIHSFFQISFGPQIPDTENWAAGKHFNREKIDIIKSIDLLVIDEISMVRADLLDAVDQVLRRFNQRNKVFGGVQVLMIGDLQQLSPVAKAEEWEILRKYYDTSYFFSSKAFQQANAICIELKHIYRQNNQEFIKILNEIRENKLSTSSLGLLNDRFDASFKPSDDEGYITLTTHNYKANEINENKLAEIKQKPFVHKASITGTFPEYSYPTDFELKLKTGAQVMFVKNDSAAEKRFFNGKIGVIEDIDDNVIFVKCKGDDDVIEVSPEKWQNLKFSLNEETKEITEEEIGSFTQYPLRLAWAITIHKSQGLTFDKAIIDAEASFSHGQTYVALSRCRTLDGIVLSSKIKPGAIICDPTVLNFNNDFNQKIPNTEILSQSKLEFEFQLIEWLFSFSRLIYLFKKLLTLSKDNSTILKGNTEPTSVDCLNALHADFEPVCQKFIIQLRKLTIENNSTIPQERIIKASEYFIQKTETILTDAIRQISFETDNKAIEKEITELIEQVYEEIQVKSYCFNSLKTGFETLNFLESRAQAKLRIVSWRPQRKKQGKNLLSKHPDLFNLLQKWRIQQADKDNTSETSIASIQILIDIADSLPANILELQNIKGMGTKRIKRYGKLILEIVVDYIQSNNIEKKVEQLSLTDNEPQPLNTRELTLKMFREGKTVEEIAKERNLSENTIETHLAFFIENGILPITGLIDDELLKNLLAVIEKLNTSKLGEIKSVVPDEVTYGQIRLALAYFEFQSKTNNEA